MTLLDIKKLLDDKTLRISIGFDNPLLIIKTEKILIDNGYKWSGFEEYTNILRNDIDHLIIYIHNENKMLSFDASFSLYGVQHHSDFMMTEENYNLLYFYFSPLPNYKPKKFTREI